MGPAVQVTDQPRIGLRGRRGQSSGGFGAGGVVVAGQPRGLGARGPHRSETKEVVGFGGGQGLVEQRSHGLLAAAGADQRHGDQRQDSLQWGQGGPSEHVVGAGERARPVPAVQRDQGGRAGQEMDGTCPGHGRVQKAEVSVM